MTCKNVRTHAALTHHDDPRLVPVRPAHRHPELDPAARRSWSPPRTRPRRRCARLARRSPRAGARQPQARPLGRRPVGRETPRGGHAHLRRGRPARARTEAERLARLAAGADLAAQPRTLRVPAYRQPAGVGGHQRRRAGGPHADLARQGRPPGPCASASARCSSGRSRWSFERTTRATASCRSWVRRTTSCSICGRCPIATWRRRSRRCTRRRRRPRSSWPSSSWS